MDNTHWRLRLSPDELGISSFAYISGGVWHEMVNPDGSGILYLPRLTVQGLSGGPITPWHSGIIDPKFIGKSFALIQISGKLSNATQGTGLITLSFTSDYAIYEDGDIYLNTTLVRASPTYDTIDLEEHLLDPKDDADITLARDTAPDLKFAGFYSNNTGGGVADLSHDSFLAQYVDYLDTYVTDTDGDRNAVGLSISTVSWSPTALVRNFRIHLSVSGSAHDITGSSTFESTGDGKAFDFRNPDPLTGGTDEGDVITGSLSGIGFDENEGCYTLTAA